MEPTILTKVHKLNRKVKLTQAYAAASTPNGMSIELYPHQAVVVKAMLDIERARVLTMHVDDFSDLTNHPAKIETSALVLSEPFGSGKTIEILAMILHQRVPIAYPNHHNSTCTTFSRNYVHATRNNMTFNTEIVRKFTGPDALIRPNLIVVGSSVLIQWENAVKNFTNLKVLIVGNFYQLQRFYELYKDRKLKCFDVILLKNGRVTGNFKLPDDVVHTEHRNLIDVVSKITRTNCWSRVIYDDFDTISIPAESPLINALFTIFVSATIKPHNDIRTKHMAYNNIIDMIKNRPSMLSGVLTDTTLFTNFNIANSPEFVELSTNIPIVESYKYVYSNPDDNYIRLLGAMGDDDANNIMEMLNGDAIHTAAEAMGIKTNSVADIFSRMLDKKYEKYINSTHILDNIDAVMAIATRFLPAGEKSHTGAQLIDIKNAIIKKQKPTITFTSMALDTFLSDLRREYQEIKDINGVAITRVIDNIKEGSCQVCCLPLEDFDTFIVRCCGLIVCDVCGIKGNQIQQRRDNAGNHTISGNCANCKATINAKTDLIFVDKKFDMDALLNAKGDEAPIDVTEVKQIEQEVEHKIKNPKLRALLNIVLG